MNIKEFEKELKKIDERYIIEKYNWSNEGERLVYICFESLKAGYIVLFDIDKYWFDGFYSENFNKDLKFYKFLELFVNFMQTPPNERVVPKKYYLRHKWIYRFCNDGYLSVNFCSGRVALDGHIEIVDWKTKFTQEEIDEIKERFNTTLEDFEQIEVEDEEV